MTVLQKIEEVKIICNNCNASQFVTDGATGEIVCSSCGCVALENSEYRGAELGNFSDNHSNTRTGPGISLKMHDKGLNTIISPKNRDAVGNPLPAKNAQVFGRLGKWYSRSHAHRSADLSLRDALGELSKLQSKLSLSDPVIERASLFYRKASEKSLIRGRTVKTISAACLYAACKDLGYSRTMSEIAEHLQLSKKNVAKSHRAVFKELGFSVAIADPTKTVSRIASKTQISEKTVRRAIKILNAAQDAGIAAGKNPETISAAVLYAACISNDEKKSQVEIADASRTTMTSLRNRIRELKSKLGLFSAMSKM